MTRFGDSGNFSAPVRFPAQKEWQIELALLEHNQMFSDLSDNTDLYQRYDKMTKFSENNSTVDFITYLQNETAYSINGNKSNEHIFVPMPLTPRDYVLVFLYSVTTLLAIIGNILAIVIFTKGKRSKTDLRPFLINLAIADLIMAIFCIPFTFTYQLLNHWIFSRPMCPIVMFLQTVSVTGSVTTNMAIGIDRFCAIAFPLNATRNRPLRYRVTILVIWIISVAFGAVQLFVGDTYSNPETGLTECKEHWPSPDLTEFYTILVLILTYLVPVIILTVTYSIVGYILWKRNLPGNADVGRDKMQLNSKVKIIKMLVTIVVLFVLCWLPLHTFFLVLSFTDPVDPSKLSLPYFICHWIAMSNSFVNPIVYSTLNDSFRADLKQLLFRCVPIRPRSGASRHGAVKIKYPSEMYKLTYSSKKNVQKPNYHTDPSYKRQYNECFNTSFSNASAMKSVDEQSYARNFDECYNSSFSNATGFKSLDMT